jgi:hypothetical protein
MLRSFPARTSSHISRSRHGSASFGQQRSYTRTLQNMPSSFPFALRPGEPKSTHAMMTSLLSRREKQLWFTWETVVNAKTDSDCGTKGSSIRNGRSQNLVHGDIVHIPAGTPHQLLIAGGTMFGAVVVTVKEARNCLSCDIAAEGPTAGAFFSWRAARATRRFRGSK